MKKVLLFIFGNLIGNSIRHLFFVLMATIFLSGCLTGVNVSGGPQVYRTSVPRLRGGLFPPQLLLTVNNTTQFVLWVKSVSAVDRVNQMLAPGQQADIPFRHFSGDCRGINVTVSAYHPETGLFVASRT
ncbi:MAG: hypothetical protein AAB946_02070, partial [Patescibacteria group bacterium]